MQADEQQLQNERRRKQMYLKEEILDKGFDPNRFSEFLCNIKPEGNNIDVWAYDELLSAVKSFKRMEQSMQDQSLDETTMSFLQYMENDQSRISTTSKRDLDTSTLSRKSEQIKAEPKVEKSFSMKSTQPAPAQKNPQPTSAQKNPQPTSVPQSLNNLSRTTTLNTSVVSTSNVNRSNTNQSVVNQNTSVDQSSLNRSITALSLPNLNPTSSNPLRAEIQNKHHPSAKDRTLMGIDLSEYVEIVPTKRAETTPLFQREHVSIIVTDPEQIKGGVFSSAFIQYTIKTKPFEWSVKRRYNDFFWLRDTLQRLHPGVFIPPIPSKKNKNKFQDETVKKRMYFFEIFLNACLEHADIKTDAYFYQFLYTLDDSTWKKIKEEADKQLRPRKMDELNTAAGEAKLDVNPDLNKYIALVEHYSNETTPIYKKIRKISKDVISHLKTVGNMAVELSECFTNLQLHTASFNKNVSPAYALRFGSLYPNLTKMMVSWSEQIQKQANSMYKNFFCFYKYAAYENDVYAEMGNFKAKLDEEYQKQARELISKKEKLFAVGDMRQWDVDVPKARLIPKEEIFKNKELAFGVMLKDESKEIKIQRDMVAYLNQSVAAEMSRGLEQRCMLYNSNFQEFINKQREHMEKLATRWEDLYDSPADQRTRSVAKAHLLNKSLKSIASGEKSDKKEKKK